MYNSLLGGRNGSAIEEISPDGVPLPGKTTKSTPAVPGTGIELTIDEPLQYVTEQSLGPRSWPRTPRAASPSS